MQKLRSLAVLLTLVLVASSCGGGDEIAAETCFDIVDETVELFQRLIDDIDEEFDDLGIEEFVTQAQDLELLSEFEEDAMTIEELSENLGCTNEQISAGVSAQAGSLTSETTAGRFVIDALISGGL